MIIIDSLDEQRAAYKTKTTVAAALYEAKVNDDEIIRLLQKYCDVDIEGAEKLLLNEKFIIAPCQALGRYLRLERGYSSHDAEVFIRNYAKPALANNTDLYKLSPAKLFEAVEKKK